MKEYLSIEMDKRQQIIQKINLALAKREEIVFAYIFGSFLDAPSFRDIDIGVYVTGIKEDDIFDYELEVAEEVADYGSIPFDIVDIKVINFAPFNFLNSVFKGRLLFSRNEQLLSDMIESSSLNALANEYIAYQSLKELVSS
jgi:hypothetical protein